MIPTGAMLREFQRLEREAGEVSLSRDEYYQLVFNAAVKLASGEWTVSNLSRDAQEQHPSHCDAA